MHKKKHDQYRCRKDFSHVLKCSNRQFHSEFGCGSVSCRRVLRGNRSRKRFPRQRNQPKVLCGPIRRASGSAAVRFDVVPHSEMAACSRTNYDAILFSSCFSLDFLLFSFCVPRVFLLPLAFLLLSSCVPLVFLLLSSCFPLAQLHL